MKLYKYISDETFRKYFDFYLNGNVYFSFWQELNDPMEGWFIVSSDVQDLKNAVVGEKSLYRVSCFCKSYKKILLWSYYANRHKGICLEYQVAKKDLPTNCYLEKIKYSPSLPALDFSKRIEDQARNFLFTKLKPWKQEGELRLLGNDLLNGGMILGCLKGIIFGMGYPEINGYKIQDVVNFFQFKPNKPRLYRAVFNRETSEIERQENNPPALR